MDARTGTSLRRETSLPTGPDHRSWAPGGPARLRRSPRFSAAARRLDDRRPLEIELIGSIGESVSGLVGLVISLLLAFACSRIAATKGRGPILWGILGFFFSIITLVVIALLPAKR